MPDPHVTKLAQVLVRCSLDLQFGEEFLNQSSIHWDMLCDMSESEITVDGELFYKDGKFVV